MTRTEVGPARDSDFFVPPKLQCTGMKLAFCFLLIYLMNFNDMLLVTEFTPSGQGGETSLFNWAQRSKGLLLVSAELCRYTFIDL